LTHKFYIIFTPKSIRNQESGIRNQESGIRNQESGIRNQESGIRNQLIMKMETKNTSVLEKLSVSKQINYKDVYWFLFPGSSSR